LEEKKEKTSLEDVVEYAQIQMKFYTKKFAANLPLEQREEIIQSGLLRIIEKYENLDFEKGWKSYIQRHCSGAVLDYIRWGAGFEEQTLPPKIKKDENGEVIEPPEDKKYWRLKQRVDHNMIQSMGSGGDQIQHTFEGILGHYGHFHSAIDLTDYRPNWELLARMASQDVDIHLVAKLLLGFTQTELASMFRVSRERLTQRYAAFCKRLDDPEYYESKWIIQTIYAFGLCHKFNQADEDLGFGWEYDPVDLWNTDINYIENMSPQMNFEFNYN